VEYMGRAVNDLHDRHTLQHTANPGALLTICEAAVKL
jgi:hypothetical protein